jgi:hypothetical protein
MGSCPVPFWNALGRSSDVVDVGPSHGQRIFRDKRFLNIHHRADWVLGALRICQKRSSSERWATVPCRMARNSVLWRVLAGLIRISPTVSRQRGAFPGDDCREVAGGTCGLQVLVTRCLRVATGCFCCGRPLPHHRRLRPMNVRSWSLDHPPNNPESIAPA